MSMDLKDRKFINAWKNRRFSKSLKYAVKGISTVFKEERNFRFDVFAAISVTIVGLYLKVSISEWIWLFLAMALVFMSEILNSAIENVVDLATELKPNKLAKKAKDMGAAAVLVTACFAILIAVLIFVPKLLRIV